MEKICFVITMYGSKICGGAEYHCKMVAERLIPYFDVDVLTTKITDYTTLEVGYTEDQENINGVRVLRFGCQSVIDEESKDKLCNRTKWYRKIRRNLFRLGLLKTVADIFPVWNFGVDREHAMLRAEGFYSPDILAYIKENHGDYKAIIFMSCYSPNTIFGFRIVQGKSILIPVAHEERSFFHSIQTHVFTGVRHIAFNTEEECKLAQQTFGRHMSPSSIVAVGVEADAEVSVLSDSEMRERFGIRSTYIHYFGRIVGNKLCKLIPWFIDYKRKYPGDLKLVLTGKLFEEKVDHPDIIYTGFVSHEEKIWLIKNARLVVNPSKHESLSLLQLEAMKLGKTVLVNGLSKVMKGHCIRSGFAADYYISKRDFQQKLHRYVYDDKLLESNSIKAKNYVDTFYNWDTIIDKFKKLIDDL